MPSYKHIDQEQPLISATVLASSVTETGQVITTLEIELPRIILAELNTHRVFSKNTSSSRAIPIKKAIQLLRDGIYFLPWFTKNKPGMTSNDLLDLEPQTQARAIWESAMESMIQHVERLEFLGVSKQYAGRLLEPFQITKMVLTSTEWNNFFQLRDHEAAQPEIRALARVIQLAINSVTPVLLKTGLCQNMRSWHVPYYQNGHWIPSHICNRIGKSFGMMVDSFGCPLEDALKLSTSQCAQVSYRNTDDTLEKAEKLFSILIDSTPSHFSPIEHQATPINSAMDWESGVYWKQRGWWCGNFRGWFSHRTLIENKQKQEKSK